MSILADPEGSPEIVKQGKLDDRDIGPLMGWDTN